MSEIRVPEMGESITEGTIVRWAAKEGGRVNQGDVLAELETDKVNLEISAEQSGVLTRILKREGETVRIGEVIAELGEAAKPTAVEAAGAGATAPGSGAEAAGAGDAAPGIGAEAAGTGAAAPGSGAEAAEAGLQTVTDETVILESADPSEGNRSELTLQAERDPEGSMQKHGAGDANTAIQRSFTASPAARKLARERGIDLGGLQPRDPIGRIRQDDVLHAAERPEGKAEAPAAERTRPDTAESARRDAAHAKESQTDAPHAKEGLIGAAHAKESQTDAPQAKEGYIGAPHAKEGQTAASNANAPYGKPVERVPMSRRRLTIASRLVEAQRNAAMLTTFNEVDMTAILDIRKRRKQSFQEKHDVGLGFMSFFTKAVVGALKAYPLLNAEIQGTEIVVKKYYDIGIAVAAKEGLVVPIVRDADRLSFAGIERQIADLASKARANKLSLADLQGGSFTITNGGVFGSLLSTPILNAPQVGILGMHKIQLRPVAIDEERSENRPMMYIALSYDHRIVDGAEAVRFLVTVKELLEDPESLLLEG